MRISFTLRRRLSSTALAAEKGLDLAVLKHDVENHSKRVIAPETRIVTHNCPLHFLGPCVCERVHHTRCPLVGGDGGQEAGRYNTL